MKRVAVTLAILSLSAFLACASGEEEGAFTGVDGYGVRTVEVRSGPLDVAVVPGDVASAELDSDVTTDFPWDDASGCLLHVEREGQRLHAWIETDGLLSAVTAARLRVRVPPGASVQVRTSSGSVTVEGLHGGTIDVHTSSGSVSLRRVSGRLLVDSVSGSVQIDSGSGVVDARTVSGRIQGRRLRLSDYCQFNSVSGSIDVGLVSDLESLGFDLGSVSGSIRVGTIRTEHGLRIGFGRTLVRARTVSGSVSFQ
ncbi:MAG TPA: DUF4097 family beta strand repeat-containing protein [Spirochaetia bacterium]|nr:DUF4097 family beta strand repeat-containing protein [Spirochaetia bacterium]